MSVGFVVREVVDGDDFKVALVILIDCAEGQSADATETIDTDFCCHFFSCFNL
jgi:hypothetical protein